MRAEEALRTTGLWGTVGDFFKGLFTGKKVATDQVPAPPVKVEEVPALPEPDIPREIVKVEEVPALPDPDIPREIAIIKKTQYTAPSAKATSNKTPLNVPSLMDIDNDEIKLMYQEMPRFFLQEFKKLPLVDQIIINARIQKLQIGPTLAPRSDAFKIPQLEKTDSTLTSSFDRRHESDDEWRLFLAKSDEVLANLDRQRNADGLYEIR
jgi:hypothetical protein